MNREAVALGTPGVHDLRGPPGRRRRAPDRRRPAAPARPIRMRSPGPRPRGRGSRACAAIPALLVDAAARPLTAWRCPRAAARSEAGAIEFTRCAEGSARRPFRCTARRCRSWRGRRAGRARVLPRLPAALRATGRRTHYEELRERRSGGCVLGSMPVLVLSRVYQRRWRYAGQRDYEAVARAVVAIVLLTVVAVDVHPPGRTATSSRHVGRRRPPERRDRCCSRCCSLVFLVGVRAIDPQRLRAPAAGGFAAAQGRAPGADRRRRRRRAPGAARDHAQPRAAA